MSTPAYVSCQESLSCGENPLSVTGNIIGILTFIRALMLSIQVYVYSMKNADRKIFECGYARVLTPKVIDDELQACMREK